MAAKSGLAVITVWLCLWPHAAHAEGLLYKVTKADQTRTGLVYQLVADRVDDKAVLVRIEIPRQGKLKALRSVGMRIGDGRPRVFAYLHTEPGKNGSLVASFQVAPDLADTCYIDLNVPDEPLSYVNVSSG